MIKELTFDFACRDDCLDKLVPSDLRGVIAERDRLRNLLLRVQCCSPLDCSYDEPCPNCAIKDAITGGR